MELRIVKPNIQQYILHMDKDDEMYQRCMWAIFNFDCDNWVLSCSSDCGDYTYRWCVEKNRSFMDLMAEIDGGYLIGKVANCNVLDVEGTFNSFIEYEISERDMDCKVYFINELKKEVLSVSSIEDMENCINTYYEDEENILSEELREVMKSVNLWEHAQCDYPERAKTFTKIFMEYIQPEIKREVIDSEQN